MVGARSIAPKTTILAQLFIESDAVRASSTPSLGIPIRRGRNGGGFRLVGTTNRCFSTPERLVRLRVQPGFRFTARHQQGTSILSGQAALTKPAFP
jgi:hypothetical protein